MDLDALRDAARAILPDDAWDFYQGTADGRADPERDARAWDRLDLLPRVLTGLREIDTSVELGGHRLVSPITIAAMAGQGACQEDGELVTAAAAASTGTLMMYSQNATIPLERFAAAAAAPWWAQIYLQRDRAATDDYVARCRAVGASALVLTVDVPGLLADAEFRRRPLSGAVAIRGNVGAIGGGAGTATETTLTPDDLARLVGTAGLPVWAKGIMVPDDAVRALDAGAAGVIVSNHGRRQFHGVAPTATVLREVVEAVDGRAPVLVDGGIRSGADAVRALALGATAVGVGRPVLWALAAGGRPGLERLLTSLMEEVTVTLAGLGVGRIADLRPEMVRPAGSGAAGSGTAG
jgi:4-hydroxymandelate oxidase